MVHKLWETLHFKLNSEQRNNKNKHFHAKRFKFLKKHKTLM